MSSDIVDLSVDNFDAAVEQGLTIVDFWADWCPPCRALAPQLEKAALQRPDVRVAKVDFDANSQLAARFGVMELPTMIVLRDGVAVDSIVGLVPAAAIIERLDVHRS